MSDEHDIRLAEDREFCLGAYARTWMGLTAGHLRLILKVEWVKFRSDEFQAFIVFPRKPGNENFQIRRRFYTVLTIVPRPSGGHDDCDRASGGFFQRSGGKAARKGCCSGLMKPDTHLGENARQIEVSDDQTT
ncbi:hypothetical protein, partial [Pseudomonas sp. SM4]|uniref:hypothetical protein n=1 Tax=Pseudomonas sp. SM4 TaxID=3424177 RepID=UPI003F7A5E82